MENNQVEAKFAISIDGLKIPEDLKNKIASELEAVVMRNIAEIDNGEPKKVAGNIIRNPGWKGLLIRRFLDRQRWNEVPELTINKELNLFT
jgi:hypothetical protein